MSESRVSEVLEEWRRLERRLPELDQQPAEQAQLHARIRELRAEYQRLTAAMVEDEDIDKPADRPADGVRPNA